jgi:hypothetical protein
LCVRSGSRAALDAIAPNKAAVLKGLSQNLDAAVIAELPLKYTRPTAKWPRHGPYSVAARERTIAELVLNVEFQSSNKIV